MNETNLFDDGDDSCWHDVSNLEALQWYFLVVLQSKLFVIVVVEHLSDVNTTLEVISDLNVHLILQDGHDLTVDLHSWLDLDDDSRKRKEIAVK